MKFVISGVNLGDMRTALLEKASEMAEQFKSGEMKSSKLRVYYNEVITICEKLARNGSDEEALNKFYLLKAKVNYDKNRKVDNKQLVPEEFARFIEEAVDKISAVEDAGDRLNAVRRFKLFFEAVVGFFKEENKKANKGRSRYNRDGSNKRW